MLRRIIFTTLTSGCLATNCVFAEHHHDDQATNEDINFGAQFFVDAVGYESTQDYKVQEALGIYNVHGGHGEDGGHSHGGELRKGLNLNNAEAHFNMNAADWLDGRLNLSMTSDGLELEEAWLRTQFLPGGFQIKGGKFLSDVGALNQLHPHAWDFVDQALPYQMLFGGALSGTGVQASWAAPTPFDLRFGIEALTGDNDGIAAQVGSTRSATLGKPIHFNEKSAWPNVWTAFIKSGAEIAPQHRLDGGLSWIKSDLHQELHTYHPGINDAEHGLEGDASMYGANLGYRFNADGQHGAGDIHISGEYWWQDKNLHLTFHELKPKLIGQPRDLSVDAITLQAIYGIAPHWQLGMRLERAGNTHEARRTNATVGSTNSSYFEPIDRISGVVTWTINPHHQLRFQVSNISGSFSETPASGGKDVAVSRNYNEFFLQYQFNFGTMSQHQH